MAIVSTDIVLRLTVKTGSAGDTTAQADPNQSLGKYASTTVMGTGANALFDDISGAENAASTVDYRCFAVLNNHATLTLQNAVVYLASEVSGGANITISVDTTAASAKGASTAQGDFIATETTAPTLVGSYSAPTTAGTGLALGNIAPGQVRFVWAKRTATNSAAVSDGVTFGISGDTAP
jgi:hypothetical protein